MATCDTPGMVTVTPNARLCRHKSMAVARGLAIVKPDEPFSVKIVGGSAHWLFRVTSW